MSSAEVINALFERTVDIVQSLPKTGPIQTSYEEKLALYSLYKQATEGDVRSKRPGMLDMLGRAKWDAWANRKGLGSQDAKQLYVESMLKTLRKFSDRPQAMQLIEELESFSGDVAQRVMSASLARAGGLDSEDDSQASSEASLSPRLNAQQRLPSGATTTGAYDTAAEDERDAVSQLPRTFASNRVGAAPNVGSSTIAGRYPGSTSASVAAGLRSGQRTPMSEVASAMAVRGGPTAGTATEGSYAGDSDEDRDVVANRDPRRQSNPVLPRQPLRPGMRPAQGQSWQRSSGSLAGGEGRLYALPNAARYPGPPASDIPGGGGNTMAGGAGASLYSAIGPSARPTPSEQHYYHHHGNAQEGTGAGSTRPYAPSSIGGRSGGGGQRAVRADVDMALQSIQASLAGLHERMSRVESRSPKGRGQGGVLSGSGHFSSAYRALADALHDIAVLLGLRSDGRGGAAPSTYRGDGAESVASRGTATARRLKGGNGGAGGRPSGWRTIFRLFLVLIQIAVRVALDLTSVVVVLTLLLFLIRRTTGRGDPLLILRLLRTWLGVRVPSRAIAAAEKVTTGSE